MIEQIFDQETVKMLDQKLDPRFVSEREGGGSKKLKYIEGHDAIDQANRILGYGNWAYRPLSCEQTILIDPLTGEAVGVSYKAQVELTVRGCIAPLVEVGSQPVATWNVEDQIMKTRMNTAKYAKKPVDEGPFTPLEKSKARGVIVEAHEQAEKGAVTDALKRALRTFGDQFGNGLYGDGRIEIDVQPTDIAIKQRRDALYRKAAALGQFEKGKTSEESSKAFLLWAGGIIGATLASASQLTPSRLDDIEAYLNSQDAA